MPEPTPPTGIRPNEWTAANKEAISDALNLDTFPTTQIVATSDASAISFTLGVPISAKVGGAEAESWTYDAVAEQINAIPHLNGDTLTIRYKAKYT